MRIAHVAVETSLMHLDKVFDYEVPQALAGEVRIGSRVRVRFAGSLVNGWVLGIADQTTHTGKLLPVQRVIGDVPPLTEATATLARTVADRYAGTLTDVLRAAVPTRHAATEAQMLATCGGELVNVGETTSPDRGTTVQRTAWVLPAGTDHWSRVARRIIDAAARGSVIAVVPDATDVAALAGELKKAAPDAQVAVLTADSGPSRRWRAFLSVRLGIATIAIGTRSAVFAPMANLAMLLVWDDGDDSHREQHAPYWHVREVAVARSSQEECDLVLAGRCISPESAALIARGWMKVEQPPRTAGSADSPMVRATGDGSATDLEDAARAARIPSAAIKVLREGLVRGSVLISVPGRGYVPVLSCAACRHIARCGICAGKLRSTGQGAPPQCSRCGWSMWRSCAECGGSALRAVRIGDERTADEIGRAFPQVPVVVSNADRRVTAIPRKPSIVVATHGCEPFSGTGYAAVVLLDVLQVINRPTLNAEADALRRFFNAAALAGPRMPVVVVADNSLPLAQALVRWDTAGWARRELEQRSSAHMPPATLMIAITGAVTAVHDFVDELNLPQPFTVFGPVAHGHVDDDGLQMVRALLVVPRRSGRQAMSRVQEVLRIRSARKAAHIRVVVDPADM